MRTVKRLLRILVIGGVAAAVVSLLRQKREPAPAFPTRAPVPDRPSVTPGPVTATAPAVEPGTEPAPSDATWVKPAAAGPCPEGYPVKAKLASKIFHVPGGASYERTTPDRCYTSAEAAEADGLRAAKR